MTTTTAPPPADSPSAALLDVRGLAALLDCSPRHCYRLADSGKLPAPLKLGALVRWRRQEILDWLAAGCPSCRKGVSQ